MRNPLVVGLMCAAAGGSAWAQLPPAPSSRLNVYAAPPVYPAPRPVAFTTRWEVELPGERIVGIAATKERVAVLTEAGELVAFSMKDGSLAWRVHDLAGASGITVQGDLLRIEPAPLLWYSPSDGSIAAAPVEVIVDGASLVPSASRFAARLTPEGRVDLLKDGREKPLWSVHAGTAFGTPPLVLTTSPGGRRPRASEIVVAGTMDGLLQAFRVRSGQLAWSRRAAGRLTRPIAAWRDEHDTGADRTRLLVAAVGSRRIEAFRALDGAPAGSQELGPEESLVLAGPVVVPGGDACAVAWSPWPAGGSRILLLGLGSVP